MKFRICTVLVAFLLGCMLPATAGEVYSPNTVGYIRIDLQADQWSLVGIAFNQLEDGSARLADVLGTSGFHNGTEVMAWDGVGYASSSFFMGTWSGDIELRRGQGFWIKAPADMELYIMGEVPEEEETDFDINEGLHLISAPYPVIIDLNDEEHLTTVPLSGDQIFYIGDSPGYVSMSYFMGSWSGAGILEPGKGYWYLSGDDQEMQISKPY